MSETVFNTIVITVISLLIVTLVAGLMYVVPVYKVWQQEKSGAAMLAKAEQEKKIMIETAKAEVEAASLQAQAIEIVGLAAQKFPEYRMQQFIIAFADALQEGTINQIIYVPTEANIPIIEAGQR